LLERRPEHATLQQQSELYASRLFSRNARILGNVRRILHAHIRFVTEMHCLYVSLFDDHWIPSPVFCRLVDSLFFYANENCNIPAMKNTGKMEFSKVLDVRGAVAGEAALANLPVNNCSSLTAPCTYRADLQHTSTPSGYHCIGQFGITMASDTRSQLCVTGLMTMKSFRRHLRMNTRQQDADGCEHPTLNRADWLTSSVRDVQYDPDVEHRVGPCLFVPCQ